MEKKLIHARDDLRKSGRTFASVEQVEALLESHFGVIGPEGRKLQTAMFPGALPVATGGFGRQVTVRPPRSKHQERVDQLLKHISQLVFASLHGVTQEVEALYVNGVLVIASNHDKAADKFLELAQAATAQAKDHVPASMLKQLVDMALLSDKRRVDERLNTAAAKMAAVVAGKRGGALDQSADSAAAAAAAAPAAAGSGSGADGGAEGDLAGLAALVRDAHVPPRIYTAAEAKAAIETGSPRVLLMHDTNIHAEQQLVRLLVQSSVKDKTASIRGTKRPCFGCYLALEYASRFQGAKGLSHGTHPGGFWLNSCQSALEFILEHPGDRSRLSAEAWVLAEAERVRAVGVNRTRELTAHTHRRTPGVPTRSTDTSVGDADADTDSDSEAEDLTSDSPFHVLLGKLAVSPPPRSRTPRTQAAAAAAASDAEMATAGDDDGDPDAAAPASRTSRGRAPGPRAHGTSRPSTRAATPRKRASKRRGRDDDGDAPAAATAHPAAAAAHPGARPAAAAAAATDVVDMDAEDTSGTDADTEAADADHNRHVDKRRRKRGPSRNGSDG